MKKLLFISALMFIAFGMNAQNTRERSNRERKPAPTETRKTTTRETRTRTTTTPPADRRKANNNSAVRPDNRNRSVDVNHNRTERRTATPANRNRSTEMNNNRPERRTVTPANNDTRHPGNENRNVNRGNTNRQVSPANRENSRRPARTVEHGNTVTHGNKITYDPKRGRTYEEQRRVYVTHAPRRVVRPVPHHSNYVHRPLEYRRSHYPYRMPPQVNIIWNESMYHRYVMLYPNFHLWYYPFGYRIHTISSYDAAGYIGEVARVYGMVYDTWYSPETDEYFLYFGGPYPYQDFSVVLEGREARKFRWRPERYFKNRYIAVTGLISLWDNKPEIDVRSRTQIDIY